MKIRLLLFLSFAAIGLAWMASSLKTTSPIATSMSTPKLSPRDVARWPEQTKKSRSYPATAPFVSTEDVPPVIPTTPDLVPMTQAEVEMEVNGGIASTVQPGEIIPQVEGEIVTQIERKPEEVEREVNGRTP